MRSWYRRGGYLLVVVVWLAVMACPVVSFLLAVRGQIQIGDDPASQLRVFLVQEDDAAGVGIQWTRRTGGDHCSRTSLRYLTWAGRAEGSSYCTCMDPVTGFSQPAGAECGPG